MSGNIKVSKINDSDVTKGVATLDDNGQLPFSQLPSAVLQAVLWRGTWDSEENEPQLLSGVGRSGDMYAVSIASENLTNLDGITKFNAGDILIFSETKWQIIRDRNTVVSVNNKVGIVQINKIDVGLGLVDNTPDTQKPLSNSMYNALNQKVDKQEGWGLTQNNYSQTDRDQLFSLENFSGKAADVTVVASGFNKNLNPTIDTAQKLANAVNELDLTGGTGVPAGVVFYTIAPNIPAGYYELDGRQIFVEQDPDLFEMFKKVVGGQWVAYLDDARGAFIRATNSTASGRDANRTNRSLQVDTLQGHGHEMNAKLNSRGAGGSRSFWAADDSALDRSRETQFESLMRPTTLAAFGGVRFSSETRPVNIAMRAIIKR